MYSQSYINIAVWHSLKRSRILGKCLSLVLCILSYENRSKSYYLFFLDDDVCGQFVIKDAPKEVMHCFKGQSPIVLSKVFCH